MVSRLDSFPAIMGLARGRPRFIENKNMGVNISVGNFSKPAVFCLDLRLFNDRRRGDFPELAEAGVESLDPSGIDDLGGRPGGRGRFCHYSSAGIFNQRSVTTTGSNCTRTYVAIRCDNGATLISIVFARYLYGSQIYTHHAAQYQGKASVSV